MNEAGGWFRFVAEGGCRSRRDREPRDRAADDRRRRGQRHGAHNSVANHFFKLEDAAFQSLAQRARRQTHRAERVLELATSIGEEVKTAEIIVGDRKKIDAGQSGRPSRSFRRANPVRVTPGVELFLADDVFTGAHFVRLFQRTVRSLPG